MNTTIKRRFSRLLAMECALVAMSLHGFVHAGDIRTRGEDTSLTVGGQFRPRYQSFPAPSRDSLTFAGNYRIRLDFDFKLGDGLRVFAQPQKVGVFGDEESGATVDFGRNEENATGFHQVYLDWSLAPKLGLLVGRFEERLADDRLVGNFDWSQRGRSFDGVRLRWGDDSNRVGLYGLKVAGERSALPGGGPLPIGDTTSDQDVLMVHYLSRDWLPGHRLEVTYLYDDDLQNVPFSSVGNFAYPGTQRSTYGFFLAKTDARGSYLSPLPSFYAGHPNETGPYWRLEFYRQTGDLGPGGPGSRNPGASQIDMDAYMYAAHLGYYFGEMAGKPLVWGGWELLSGDNDPTDRKFKAFDTLYPTNHAYYGYMDYFLLNIPSDTASRGLRDAFITANIHPLPKTAFNITWHNFQLDKEAVGASSSLGDEIDFTVAWRAHKNLVLLTGYSRFFTKRGMEDLGRIAPGEDPSFAYIMANAQF